MGQVDEVRPGEDRLREVHHRVAALLPGEEHARLGLPAGIDGAIEESDPRVPASGIGEDAERVALRPAGKDSLLDSQFVGEPLGLRGAKSCGDARLLEGEAVVGDRVLEPEAGLLRSRGPRPRRGEHGNEKESAERRIPHGPHATPARGPSRKTLGPRRRAP